MGAVHSTALVRAKDLIVHKTYLHRHSDLADTALQALRQALQNVVPDMLDGSQGDVTINISITNNNHVIIPDNTDVQPCRTIVTVDKLLEPESVQPCIEAFKTPAQHPYIVPVLCCCIRTFDQWKQYWLQPRIISGFIRILTIENLGRRITVADGRTFIAVFEMNQLVGCHPERYFVMGVATCPSCSGGAHAYEKIRATWAMTDYCKVTGTRM